MLYACLINIYTYGELYIVFPGKYWRNIGGSNGSIAEKSYNVNTQMDELRYSYDMHYLKYMLDK